MVKPSSSRSARRSRRFHRRWRVVLPMRARAVRRAARSARRSVTLKSADVHSLLQQQRREGVPQVCSVTPSCRMPERSTVRRNMRFRSVGDMALPPQSRRERCYQNGGMSQSSMAAVAQPAAGPRPASFAAPDKERHRGEVHVVQSKAVVPPGAGPGRARSVWPGRGIWIDVVVLVTGGEQTPGLLHGQVGGEPLVPLRSRSAGGFWLTRSACQGSATESARAVGEHAWPGQGCADIAAT